MLGPGWLKHIPNVHILHAHDNVVVVVEESAVKVDDKLGMAAVHNLQLSDNALADFAVRLDVNDLENPLVDLGSGRPGSNIGKTDLASHNGSRCKMLDLADSAAIAVPQLLKYFEVFRS
jgi:hypothetical protein